MRSGESLSDLEFGRLLHPLTAFGEDAPNLEQKLELLHAVRCTSADSLQRVDRFLLGELARQHSGLLHAQEIQEEVRGLLETFTAPPQFPAIFLGTVTAEQPQALVISGNSRRVVTVAADLQMSSLEIGDEVLLSNELNAIMGRSPVRSFSFGETALFERYTPDRRAVLKWRDDEVVVDLAAPLSRVELKSGDQVRWDRTAWMAFEKIERSQGTHLFLEETPSETFADIGGLDHKIEEVQRSILLHLQHSDLAKRYGLRRKGSVLLVGSPGNGKTMLARALANWLGRLSKSGRARFMNIKPAGLHSMWYSQSEANYREAFRVAREASILAQDVPIVMFFDEIDHVGASRGESLMRVDDRVLTAFMTELDGLEARGNVLVVAATNRPDALDPALLRPGRLGDCVIEIPRPNRKAAHDIFTKYLRPEIAYGQNGHGDDAVATRAEIIASAVSRIYSPNGDGDLAKITFRDGKTRTIKPSDLVSGAVISKIAQLAIERACWRELDTGESGVCLQDVLSAVAEEFASAVRSLTPANCRKHLSGLPQDVDVVAVEPIVSKAPPVRYLNMS